jgi:hypothetical protein
MKAAMEAHPVIRGNGAAADGEMLRIRCDGIVAEASMPLPCIDTALRNLSRQSLLLAPAKVALSGDGTTLLLAEVPASIDRERAQDAVRAALESAVLWAAGNGAPIDDAPVSGVHVATAQSETSAEPGETEPSGAAGASSAGWIEEALGTLAWTWEREDQATLRVTESTAESVARIAPVAHGRGVRLWHEARPLRVSTPGVEQAVRLFALEANARFRLARLSVGDRDDGAGSRVIFAVWDTVVLPDIDGVRWLGQAIEALAGADGETRRALRALTDGAIAEAYIAARDPRRRENAA